MVAPLADEKEFVQTHKSFFVNLKYIKSIRENYVLLDNGTEIPVAKRRKTELQNKYMAYTFGDEIFNLSIIYDFSACFFASVSSADETKMESDNGNGNGIYPDEYCGLYEF